MICPDNLSNRISLCLVVCVCTHTGKYKIIIMLSFMYNAHVRQAHSYILTAHNETGLPRMGKKEILDVTRGGGPSLSQTGHCP